MNEKILVIGQGFLTTYLMPCYERLLGENISRNMIGIKGSPRDLEKRRAECKYPVIVGNAAETLREMRPDIIILGVKPNQIAGMTENTLKPYYDLLRENGEPMSDLYSFAPDPTVDYFTDTLGMDVRAANMIPNMVSRIQDLFVAPVGVSFVSFDPRIAWPEETPSRSWRSKARLYQGSVESVSTMKSCFSIAVSVLFRMVLLYRKQRDPSMKLWLTNYGLGCYINVKSNSL